jgi:hypothetical protein
MIQLIFRTGLFATKDGAISATVQELHPSVCIVVCIHSGSDRVKPGSILIRNGELKKRSKVGAEWANYPDLYSALRGMVAALRRGGAQPDVTDGELQEQTMHPQTLRRCAQLVFSEAIESEYMRRASALGIEFIIGSLRKRRAEPLTFAYLDTLRGVQNHDVNGRYNPGAAAMALGGAIHQIDLRQVDLRYIMKMLDLRVARMVDLIKDIVDSYEALLVLVGGRELSRPSDEALFLRISEQQTYSKDEATEAIGELESFIQLFKGITVLPHARNARYMQTDLERMRIGIRTLAKGWNERVAADLHARILKLRQGVLWFLAFHALQILRAKLSWTLKDISREARIVELAVNGATHEDAMNVSFVEAERRLGVIHEEMCRYARRLRKCSDTLLSKRIGGATRLNVDKAIRFAEAKNWKDAKKSLAQAASFM